MKLFIKNMVCNRCVLVLQQTLEELNMPEILYDFIKVSQGLVLFVGPTGQGKSTTLAALMNQINHTQHRY